MDSDQLLLSKLDRFWSSLDPQQEVLEITFFCFSRFQKQQYEVVTASTLVATS